MLELILRSDYPNGIITSKYDYVVLCYLSEMIVAPHSNSSWSNVVNCRSRKIKAYSNSATQQCDSVAIAGTVQYYLLNSVSWNNSDLFKFGYAIALQPLFEQHCLKVSNHVIINILILQLHQSLALGIQTLLTIQANHLWAIPYSKQSITFHQQAQSLELQSMYQLGFNSFCLKYLSIKKSNLTKDMFSNIWFHTNWRPQSL